MIRLGSMASQAGSLTPQMSDRLAGLENRQPLGPKLRHRFGCCFSCLRLSEKVFPSQLNTPESIEYSRVLRWWVGANNGLNAESCFIRLTFRTSKLVQ